ncbi:MULTISPECIES: metallophosphoesterase [Streptomyces]|uniref:Calcineurin n=1 Tax=Streptomyces qinglanensis TaxID=943816 RepID=A0A1E7K7A0_9ACTN|nr:MULTISPECIES: metallophosphoesterase [Streptomyces]OEU99790.1 calcineurin [Streptomyces qinglanensis]OEV27448.1 calcineurin [Streptomyces nanshensis]
MGTQGTGTGVSRRTVLAGAGGVGAAAVLGGASVPQALAAGVDKLPIPDKAELTVLLTGDAGTGEDGQWQVADAARTVCARRGVDLAIGLGDNIYENGPESDTDDEFQSKFERPNAGIDVPWLMVLGNHDTSGIIPGSGGWPSRGDHEVAYHAHSARWYMPGRYYSVAVPGGADEPVAEFFAIDTTPLASYVLQTDPEYYWNGPFAREQRAWLQQSLAASRARWKFVFAHHPLRNNGTHRNAGEYEGISCGDYLSGKHVKELYEDVVAGKAEFLLGGHDHTLQILDTAERYQGTQQIVCGAAAKTKGRADEPSNKAFWEAYDTLGFMLLTINAQQVVLDAYTLDPGTGEPVHAYRHTRTDRLPAGAGRAGATG